jgi:hypothetical protein
MVIVISAAMAFVVLRMWPYAALPFARARVAIAHSWYQMDNEEAALLFQSAEIRKGHSIYHQLFHYPYVVGTYPPVYLILNALLLNPENITFLSGRIVSSASAIGIAVILIMLIVLRSRHLLAGLVAALLFIVSYEVYNWIPYFRVDLLAILFSVLGVSCMALSPGEKSGWFVSILCFTLAIFTKQTQVAGPLAVIWFLFMRDWRAAFRYLSYLAIAIAVPLAALTIATHGQFLLHTVFYNMNTYNSGDLVIWARHILLFYPWLLAAAGISLAFLFLTAAFSPARTIEIYPPQREKKIRTGLLVDPLPLYMILSILNYLAIGKAGSAENYLLEPLAAFSLFIGDTVGRLSRRALISKRGLIPATGALAVTALLVLHANRVELLSPYMFSPGKTPGTQDIVAAELVARIVALEPESTWTELGVFNMLSGRSIYFQPFIMSELARQHKWNQAAFLDDLRSHKFQLIVTTFDINSAAYATVLTKEMLQAIRNGYREERRITSGRLWKYYLYRPVRIGKPRLDIAFARNPDKLKLGEIAAGR